MDLTVELTKLPIRIGRAPECDLRLDDSSVSRNHAVIDTIQEQFIIDDLDSVNGVWVNGTRITTRTELKHNDQIMIGDYELRFKK